MKSNKQRRAEIKQLRLTRAAHLEAQLRVSDGRHLRAAGMEPAARAVLAQHNNSYSLPSHYLDRAFICRDCGCDEVWTAKQQKWWYEVVHAPIDSGAVRCLACRRARRIAMAASQAVAGADRLALETRALRALGRAAPTDEARAQVEVALRSKWWGVRAVAIGVLGVWRRDVDVQRLMRMVDGREDEAQAQTSAWARTRQAAARKALQHHPQEKVARTARAGLPLA